MPDDLLNPYAPPVAAEPLAPPDSARLWMVHGDHLLVRDGARIPPVSLYGEDDGRGLTPSHQIFAAPSGTSTLAKLVPVAIAALVMLFIRIASDRVAVLEGLLAFFIGSLLLRRFTKIGPSLVNVHCHLSITALRARARRDRWRGWLTMTALLALVPLLFGGVLEMGFFIADDDLRYAWEVAFRLLLGFVMIASLLVSVISGAMERGLKCVSHTGGWCYLSGVPASSLLKLAAMSPEPPPLRPRKVYSLYQYRLPLGILLGPRRNPLLVLIVAIMKVLRSPAFVRRSFHWSEARRDAKPDREFATRIGKLHASVPELAAWKDRGCSRLDSPQGELRVLAVTLASPDGRHLCVVTLARLSKARSFLEIFQTSFRTWTSDGRCLVTTDKSFFPCLPPYLDLQRVKGGPARLWSRHLRRCEQVTTKPVDQEESKHLLEKEADDHHRLMEAAGIHGPIEEVDMPGDWEEVAGAVETSGRESDPTWASSPA